MLDTPIHTAQKPLLSGEFLERDTDGSRGIIEKLIPIIRDNEQVIEFAIPSVRRIQKIFGPIETVNTDEFTRNLIFDLSLRADPAVAQEAAVRILPILKELEIAMLEHYVYTPHVLSEENPFSAERVDTLSEIISRTLYREWNPEKGSGIIDNLLKQFHGNRKYAGLTEYRDRKDATDTPFDDDSTEEKVKVLAALRIKRSSERSTAPSAESEFFRIEAARQLIELSRSSEYAYRVMCGQTIEEIADVTNATPYYVKNRLRDDLIEIVLKGRELYDWTDGFSTYVLHVCSETEKLESKTPQTIPTEVERVDMLKKNNASIEDLFACISLMTILQQKVLLRYFGYLEDDISTVHWLNKAKISEKLYRTELHKAFANLERLLPTHPQLSANPTDMIHSCENHIIIESSDGRAQNERGSLVRLLNLSEKPRAEATLSLRETILIEKLRTYFEQNKTVPNIAELATMLDVKYTTATGMIKWLLEWDFESPRYATKEYIIARDKARYHAIKWYDSHKEDADMRMQLLGLPQRQFDIFMASVVPVNGYYLTLEEIFEIFPQESYSDSANIAELHSDLIRKALVNIHKGYPVKVLYDNLLQLRGSSRKKEFEIAREAIIARLESNIPIGKGTIKEIALSNGISVTDVAYVIQQAKNLNSTTSED